MKKFCLLFAVLIFSRAAFAADCNAPKPPLDLSDADLRKIYACIKPEMQADYAKRGVAWSREYVKWRAAATAPARPGVHSNQYLMTYVNDIGYDAYIKYGETGAAMPLGTLIAKEAFAVKKNKKIKIGPLMFMQKVGVDAAPETDGWRYYGVRSNGKRLKVQERDFCHACHRGFAQNDYLGFPKVRVRIGE